MLKSRDLLPALLVFFGLGLCPAIAGLVFVWSGGQVSTLLCTRIEPGQVDCRLQRKFLGIVPTHDETLVKLQSARLKEECDPDGCIYWVELITNQGAIPLTKVSVGNRKFVQADVERIEGFLENTEAKSLELTTGPAWTALIISTPFIVIGGIILIVSLNAFIKHKG